MLEVRWMEVVASDDSGTGINRKLFLKETPTYAGVFLLVIIFGVSAYYVYSIQAARKYTGEIISREYTEQG